MLTDANGVGRGKIIRRHELLGLYENGRHLPISILGLDITGEDVHETGLIWDSGDGDLRAWPIPGTLVPLHGTQPGARPGADVDVSSRRHADDLGPAPCAGAAGRALRRQRACIPAGAFELEFFLLANERDAEGRVQPAERRARRPPERQDRGLFGRPSARHGAAVLRHLRGRRRSGHSGRDGHLRICAGPVRADAATTARMCCGPPTISFC